MRRKAAPISSRRRCRASPARRMFTSRPHTTVGEWYASRRNCAHTSDGAYASLATRGPNPSTNRPTGYGVMMGSISSRTRSGASESTINSMAGSVFTIGIGRPSPSSERARNRSVSGDGTRRRKVASQKSRSAGGSQASRAATRRRTSDGARVTRKCRSAPRHTATARASATRSRANRARAASRIVGVTPRPLSASRIVPAASRARGIQMTFTSMAKRPPAYPTRLSRQLADRQLPSDARGKLTRLVATGSRAYGAARRATSARLASSRSTRCSSLRKRRFSAAGTRGSAR